ncbi:hypothetical protein Efla_006698 [Eimeria flavescens]
MEPGSPPSGKAVESPFSQRGEQEHENYRHHHHHHHHSKGTWYNDCLFLGSILSGIYLFFLMFGYYQEKIYSTRDPESGERFSFSCFLVLMACISNALFSCMLILLQHRRRALDIIIAISGHSLKEISLISLSYAGSMLCTNYALTHVNYPTQILVKSAKMVPVLVGGVVFFGKRYPWQDYLSVIVVTSSLAVFQLCKSEAKAGAGSVQENSLLGLLLLSGSLLCDGLTGPRQDRLLAREKHFSSLLMMFITNAFAILWIGAATLVAEGLQPIRFLMKQPDAGGYLFAFAVCGSLGQLFIYQSLKHFGSLYTSLFTTIRKAASTLFSVYAFGHQLNEKQWAAFAAMFSVILLQSYVTKKNKKQPHHQPEAKKDD